MRNFLVCFFVSIFFMNHAQNTLGLITNLDGNHAGYVLFAPNSSNSTYLIDKCGKKVKEWVSTYKPGLSCYLLSDGSLLRTGSTNNTNFPAGGSGGVLEKFDWDGNLIWSYSISDDNQCQHHDICPLPNGNILAIVWDRKLKSEAIANGKNTSYGNDYLWSEKIVELQPVGTNGANIVWEWKVWDHLMQDFNDQLPNYSTISEHPELININYFPGSPTSMDWIHFNSIDYNSSTNQLLLSSHTMNEIWIIDHSTSTIESASHTGGQMNKGGDLLYRWGNPLAYQRGINGDKKLFGQHHATFIPENYPNTGKVLVFNNGLNRPQGNYSSIDMIELPIDNSGNYSINSTDAYLPLTSFWSYTDAIPTDFYASNISGCYPIQNGNFLISNGTNGTIFEIDGNKNVVWKYINPVTSNGILSQGDTPTANILFRANFYPANFEGFNGGILESSEEIELNPTADSNCTMETSGVTEINSETISIFPNPVTNWLQVQLSSFEKIENVSIYDQFGKNILETKEALISLEGILEGVYFIRVLTVKNTYVLKFTKL